MECTGKLKAVSKNWITGKWELLFEIDQDITGSIDGIKDKLLRIVAKVYRKRRSLDANSYYWVLLTKLARFLNQSNAVLHNLMLRRYGQPEMIDDQLVYLVLPESNSAAAKADAAETYHIRPTSEVKPGADGKLYRTYIMLRGSSTYDTAEMGRLIDGLVSECQQMGIETLPQEEIERMKREWGVKVG